VTALTPAEPAATVECGLSQRLSDYAGADGHHPQKLKKNEIMEAWL